MRATRRNKYRVAPKSRRTDSAGKTYASRAEMLYAGELRTLGVEFTEQPRITLGDTGVVYVPDFYLTETNEYVDVKGVQTAVFRLKKKLWKLYGPAPLRIVVRRGHRFVTKEVVPTGSKVE